MWTEISTQLPEECEEVILFNPEYRHEDFNQEGITVGFMLDGHDFIVAVWENDYDTWFSRFVSPGDELYPTHWQPKPSPPKI